jgi:hypothetical protein
VAIVVAAGSVIAACGGVARSAAAVCNVFETQVGVIRQQFRKDAVKAPSDPLPVLKDAVTAPQEFATLMANMAAVAPAPIESDFESLAHYFKLLQASEPGVVVNPLRSFAGDAARTVEASSALRGVDDFLSSNCSSSGTTTT